MPSKKLVEKDGSITRKKLDHRDRYRNVHYTDKRKSNETIRGDKIQVRLKKVKGTGTEPEITWSYTVEGCPDYLREIVTEKAKFQNDQSASASNDYHYKRFVIPPVNNVKYTLTAAYPDQDPVEVKVFTAKQRCYLNFKINDNDLNFNTSMKNKISTMVQGANSIYNKLGIDIQEAGTILKKSVRGTVRDVEEGSPVLPAKCKAQTTVTIKQKYWDDADKLYRFQIKKTGADTFEFHKLGLVTDLGGSATCKTLESYNNEKLLQQFSVVDGHFLKLYLPESEIPTYWSLEGDINFSRDKNGGIKGIDVNHKTFSSSDAKNGPKVASAYEQISKLETRIDLTNSVVYPDENPDSVAIGDIFTFDIHIVRYEYGKTQGNGDSASKSIKMFVDLDNCNDNRLGVLLAHELGHVIDMVDTGSETHHTQQGGNGHHCTHNTVLNPDTDVRNPINDTVDLCVMHWSCSPYQQQMKGFCQHCSDFIRKRELVNWPRL
ncbi:MAG: hypothetical protein OCC49_01325 [Fibrobacterales bacterium]